MDVVHLSSSTARHAGFGVGVYALVVLALAPAAVDPLAIWVAIPGRGHGGDVAWRGVEVLAAVLLVGWGAGVELGRARRVLGALLAALAAIAAVDAALFYDALARGTVVSIAWVPASAFAAVLLGALSLASLRDAPRARWTWTRAAGLGAVALAALVVVPLAELGTFGVSRYERRADRAIVFGARAYADGTPSEALADRVDEAASLYRRGLVKKLYLSGGIDRRARVSEPDVMRARAEADGVRPEDIELDEAGVDTRSTVADATKSMREHGETSALVVTHWFHEPRAKLLFDAAGVRTFTVPARMRRRLLAEPYFVAREIAAHYVALARA
jgi:vancomycin permeability regulator SanA